MNIYRLEKALRARGDVNTLVEQWPGFSIFFVEGVPYAVVVGEAEITFRRPPTRPGWGWDFNLGPTIATLPRSHRYIQDIADFITRADGLRAAIEEAAAAPSMSKHEREGLRAILDAVDDVMELPCRSR